MDGKEIAKAINVKLAEVGMTKATLERLTGVSRASISNWNTGRAQPSAEALAKINAALGTNFTIQTAVSDTMYETIEMLQQLRDEDRILLQVARDMTPQQVQLMTEFGRTIKRIGKGEETD